MVSDGSEMKIIRVAGAADLDEMVRMFSEADDHLRGLTSLSADHAFNEARLDEAKVAMEQPLGQAARFLFVLANSETGQISGTCGIGLPGDHTAPGHLLDSNHDFASSEAVRSFRAPAISLVNVADGCGEFQSLFLETASRGGGMGTLLSRSRMLLLADHADRFPEEFVSELRGRCDADGTFPFWEGLGRHYTGLSSRQAEAIVATVGTGPLAEMLPREAIPLSLLDERTRSAIGEVHPATEGARKLLAAEGFTERGLVNILDAGPMPMVRVAEARSVVDSVVASAKVVDMVESPQRVLLSNRKWKNFRATLGAVGLANFGLQIDGETADALQVEDGDEIRYLSLEVKNAER